jgi:hypothetical protein
MVVAHFNYDIKKVTGFYLSSYICFAFNYLIISYE